VAFSSSIPPEPVTLLTDPLRLRQVVTNLIDNALKFTARGEVRVQLSADEQEVVIAVRDTGIGIAPEDVPRIVEDFRQLDGGPARRFRGCGLGLAVSRRLLDRLNGRLEVESELGRGSCFRVRLPRRPSVPSAPGPEGSV